MTKYKYQLNVGHSMAEAVHGTITQQQAWFFKKNFGKDYQDILHNYIQNFDLFEINESNVIPEEYQLPSWHDIDDYEHINAVHYNHANLHVMDEDGNDLETHDVTKTNQVVKMEGYMFEQNYEPTIDDKVHLYSWSEEKGSFDFYTYDKDDKETTVLELDKPFDVKNMKYSCTSFDGDVFLTGASYNDNGLDIEFDLMSDYSHGKGSGTYINEDTLTDEEVDVVMLDTHAKMKFLELIEYEGDEARAELQEELDKMENDFVESLENTFNEALAETNVVNFMNIFNEQEKKQSQK